METFIKITKIVLNIITTVIIILGILFITLYVIGIQPYVVESGSMEPTIKTGSVCFINKRANYDEMKVGDIIAFRLETGAYATHRINSITKDGFETKGDANKPVDSTLTTKDNFIGKNIISIPKAGFFIKILQTPKGKILLSTIIIILFLAAILIGEPSKKSKEKKQAKSKH